MWWEPGDLGGDRNVGISVTGLCRDGSGQEGGGDGWTVTGPDRQDVSGCVLRYGIKSTPTHTVGPEYGVSGDGVVPPEEADETDTLAHDPLTSAVTDTSIGTPPSPPSPVLYPTEWRVSCELNRGQTPTTAPRGPIRSSGVFTWTGVVLEDNSIRGSSLTPVLLFGQGLFSLRLPSRQDPRKIPPPKSFRGPRVSPFGATPRT